MPRFIERFDIRLFNLIDRALRERAGLSNTRTLKRVEDTGDNGH
jgi:hypothetical protein